MSVPVQYAIGGRSANEVAASVEGAVRGGHIAPGESLPTVRALAARLGLSPATVAAAYRALRARGLVTGQGRRGTRVAFRPPLLTPRLEGEVPSDLVDVATGNPDPALLPPWGAARAAVGHERLLYNGPAHRPALIRLASRQLAADAIPTHALAVVGGAMDGVERVLQAYLQPGDRGPVAGVPAFTVCHRRRERWAVVRSVSKWLGPDLRLALLAGDPVTVGRVEGRQALGSGWVSHLLQDLVIALWSDPRTEARLLRASAAYRERRDAFVAALARRGVQAHGRSGLNVWVPVAEEGPVLTALATAGWAVRGGQRYRIRSGPAIRITTAALLPRDGERLAEQIGRALRPARRTTAP